LGAAHRRDGLGSPDFEASPTGSHRRVDQNGAASQIERIGLAISVSIHEIVFGTRLCFDPETVMATQNLPLRTRHRLHNASDTLCSGFLDRGEMDEETC
jgi:hypothetical protein